MATTFDGQNPNPAPGGPVVERKSDFIDVGAILLAFKRRLWLWLPIAVLLFAAVLVVYTLLPARYEATSQVVVDTHKENIVGTEQVDDSAAPDTFAVDTEVQVLKSRTLARKVVEQLKLYANPDFVKPDDMPLAANPQAARAAAIDIATETLLKNRTVARSGLAFVIDIKYLAATPQEAMRIANTLADTYVGSQLDAKARATSTASSWLDSRLAGLRTQVLAAETAVQRYRAANGLFNTSPTETTTQQQISQIGNELATAQADLAERQARANTARAQLRSGSTGDDVGEALGSAVVTQLRQQRADISRQLADYQSRYGPQHPDYIRAQNQLKDIDAQIATEIQRVISSLDAQVQVSRGRVGSLQGNVGRSQGTLAVNSAAGVRLADLERSAEAVRTLYQTYLNRYRETSSQQGLERPDSRVLTYASEPAERASPKLSMFLPVALIASLIGAGVAVALAEAVSRGMRSSTNIREGTGLRTIASVPAFRSTLSKEEARAFRTLPANFIVERPFSAFTESFRMLRAALYDRTSGKPYQVVAVCSALPHEGKTTTSMCLARVAAAGGERTVLVQCDTRRAGLQASQADIEIGLLEVLAGTATLDQALQLDATSGAYILPISRRAVTPHDILTAASMEAVIQELRGRFDLIVLDTAPILAIAESRLLASKADAVAFLVRWGHTPKRAAAAGVRILDESGANISGAVLTQVDLNQQKNWAREDGGAYYDKYKDYYS